MANYVRITSNLLFEKLKEFEGFRSKAYKCPGGVWTCGYGHTFGVRKGDVFTRYWADEMLREDIKIAESQVIALGVCKTQGQLDALVDFVFNVGIKNLRRSTLMGLLCRGETDRKKIANAFMMWTMAGGKKLPGLVKRRQWEVKRFFEDEDCEI